MISPSALSEAAKLADQSPHKVDILVVEQGLWIRAQSGELVGEHVVPWQQLVGRVDNPVSAAIIRLNAEIDRGLELQKKSLAEAGL